MWLQGTLGCRLLRPTSLFCTGIVRVKGEVQEQVQLGRGGI
jgi:hypothetical protein